MVMGLPAVPEPANSSIWLSQLLPRPIKIRSPATVTPFTFDAEHHGCDAVGTATESLHPDPGALLT